jgi:hypothetical protein
MARTRLVARKSTGRQPTGQLAPRDVTPPQSQLGSLQLVSQEEEPFEIEVVVPESPEAQDTPAEDPE